MDLILSLKELFEVTGVDSEVIGTDDNRLLEAVEVFNGIDVRFVNGGLIDVAVEDTLLLLGFVNLADFFVAVSL